LFHVLIVDDNIKNIQLAATVLKEVGYKIIYANSGEQALQRLQEGEIHLILLDVMMPGMDGYETSIKIKSTEKIKDIPIIFLTANADEDSLLKGFSHGAVDYVTKPFNAMELKARVKTQLELYSVKQQLHETLNENIQLLQQYKEIIDTCTIVSKSDLQGRITYVNEAFEKISGYTKDELIGKQHNIVRHPEMSKEVFTEMWQTIQSKKIWKGVVKNLAKSGKTYIVDSYVMPIVNLQGNIIEYISARHDITEIYHLKEEMELTQREILAKLGEATERRSKETGAHVQRVSEYSYILAKAYGLSEKESTVLKRASPMHDIGKIAISDNILLKPGPLTQEEFEIMKTHATIGYEIFKDSRRSMLRAAATISHEHHERWDGTGYPRNLKGENIHIYGRISAIADVFDALSHDRCYKKAWSEDKVLELIQAEKAKQFDPTLVDIFFENIDDIRRIRDNF